jgi:RNA polymerase sigma-70 factor (ECF subfamily)
MLNMNCIDSSWLTAAYAQHKDYLINYTFSFINDRTEAECIVQHAFLQAHRKQTMQDYVLKWLMTVCHNTAVNFVRSRSRVNYHSPDTLLENSEKDNLLDTEMDVSPSEITLDNERKAELQSQYAKALAKLGKLKNKSLKKVIELRYFENKSYKEISQIMRIKLGTVGFKLNYALKLLNQHLTCE